jgi:hypothetical protein
VVGFPLGVLGLYVALKQISHNTRVTQAVSDELRRVKLQLHVYDANHELAKATQSLHSAKKHLGKREWNELAEDYDLYSRSMHIVQALQVSGLESFDERLSGTLQYANKLCERITSGEANEVRVDAAKTGSAIREHEQLISSLNIALQGRALQ